MRCPFCLQPVTEQYKKNLFESIESVLSKAAEEHTIELGKMFIEQIDFDYQPYQELDAKGENADYELVVGNSMRRVMEAYGSFMYKKGIEQLSTASEIKQKLEPPFGDHFENLMYRLVLHGGSHN